MAVVIKTTLILLLIAAIPLVLSGCGGGGFFPCGAIDGFFYHIGITIVAILAMPFIVWYKKDRKAKATLLLLLVSIVGFATPFIFGFEGFPIIEFAGTKYTYTVYHYNLIYILSFFPLIHYLLTGKKNAER